MKIKISCFLIILALTTLFQPINVFAKATLNDAISKYQSGKLTEAYKTIKKLLDSGDERKNVFIYGGIISSDLGKHQESIEILYKGLALFPDDPGILKIMGRNLLRQGRYLEAFEILKSIISKGNKDFKVREYTGDAAVGLGRYEDAIHYYNRALKLKPSEAWIYIKLGRVQKALKKRKAAFGSFKQALKISEEKGLRLIKTVALYELKQLSDKDK